MTLDTLVFPNMTSLFNFHFLQMGNNMPMTGWLMFLECFRKCLLLLGEQSADLANTGVTTNPTE